ncbi:MAG: M14 family zinc carboxypeptidase [Peribacillus sp.]
MKKIILLWWICFLLYPSYAFSEKPYSPEIMEKDLLKMEKKYQLKTVIIGKTEKGKPIKAVKLGRGQKSILMVGAHHGREWLSTMILMKMLQDYASAYQTGKPIGDIPSDLLDEVSIWFIPMLNPDGVRIQQGDFSHLNVWERVAVWKMNDYSTEWSRWKANANGIDLNRQYPSGWDDIINEAKQPTYQFYKGKRPLMASEAKALVSFTKKLGPLIAVSYHTSGREIFWHYHNKPKNMARDYGIAKKTAELTGYELTIPEKEAIGSGFTDWFITEFERPALTIELSYLVEETNPPLSVFPEEWDRNRQVGMMLVQEANRLNNY